MTRPLTERDYDVLECLEGFNQQLDGNGDPEGARPMDIGASDASHHCSTLKKLEGRGLVQSRTKWTNLERRTGGPRLYWVTDAGRTAVEAFRKAGREVEPTA